MSTGLGIEEFPPCIVLESTAEESVTTKVEFSEEMELIRKFSPPSIAEIQARQIFLGEKTSKYTLFLDLDETLISGRSYLGISSINHDAQVIVRPFAEKLLEELSPFYELVIFTAAGEDYAMSAVKCLDPELKYIKKVLSQQHCILADDKFHYIKDLRIIADRKLDEMLIVDNSIISFAFQMECGIPVSSFYGDSNDGELKLLLDYLLELYNQPNIVESNKTQIDLC